jgi:hypothetical protein
MKPQSLPYVCVMQELSNKPCRGPTSLEDGL